MKHHAMNEQREVVAQPTHSEYWRQTHVLAFLCLPFYTGYRLNMKLGESQSPSGCSCVATAVVNNLWNVQCNVANKIFLELYLPMSFYNSKKNLLILHFLHLSDNFQLIWYTPLIQGLLIGSYTDERNDLYTENTIWHPSVRLHWIGQRDHILTSGFLTTNTLHILTWHTPGVDCPLETTNVMEMKYHLLWELTDWRRSHSLVCHAM